MAILVSKEDEECPVSNFFVVFPGIFLTQNYFLNLTIQKDHFQEAFFFLEMFYPPKGVCERRPHWVHLILLILLSPEGSLRKQAPRGLFVFTYKFIGIGRIFDDSKTPFSGGFFKM